MSDTDKEHLSDILSNYFWAGYLIDLPKDQAWKLANGIVEEIKFALSQANGVSDNHQQALPINSVSQQRGLLVAYANWENEQLLKGVEFESHEDAIEIFLSNQ